MNGIHPIKIEYNFFKRALFRNKDLEISELNALKKIDISKLEREYDIVLLPEIDLATSLSLRGIKDSKIPVIARAGDPHAPLAYDIVGMADSLGVDWFFSFYTPASFYEYYPKQFRYETIHMGLESSLYENTADWADRVPDRIALSGILDKPDLVHKAYYRIYLRRPKVLSSDWHYKLRTKCNKLPYVVHTRDVYPGQSTEQLPAVLSMFNAAIAATTSIQTVKYKETPAAGCLTFMEVTERNGGSFLGYEDGKSAIFINESNYKKKFQEYLDSPNDPRWSKIASEGRRHALENLSNDVGVENLVHVMRKALGEKNAKI